MSNAVTRDAKGWSDPWLPVLQLKDQLLGKEPVTPYLPSRHLTELQNTMLLDTYLIKLYSLNEAMDTKDVLRSKVRIRDLRAWLVARCPWVPLPEVLVPGPYSGT